MNAMDDNTLTREEQMGFYMFLVSEARRHMADVARINAMLIELDDRLSLTEVEVHKLYAGAAKYVKFDLWENKK